MSLNVCTFSGNTGGECELRYMPDGKPVAAFNLAVNNGYGDKKSTFWVRCQIYGKRAETLSPMISKGTKLMVSGSLAPREWTDKEGKVHTSLDMNVNELEFAGSKPVDEGL